MIEIKEGTVVLDQSRVLVVKSVESSTIFYTDGTVTGSRWAEDHVSPVQPGDRIFTMRQWWDVTEVYVSDYTGSVRVRVRQDPTSASWSLLLAEAEKLLVPELSAGDFVTSLRSGKPARVTRIEDDRVWYADPEFEETWGDYDAVAKRKVEQPAAQHFATGSTVRFRQDVTYTVTDFDGELHELEPDDGSETLHFSPDFFELVSPPPLEPGAVVRYDGRRWLVDYETNGIIELTAASGLGKTLSREAFYETGEVLLP